jgi:phosphoribosyl 1,2-cyclic phosphate phosphodiesterase
MTDEFEVVILGCGSSGGVPRLGGPDGRGFWGACDSSNPRNRRRRCSLLARRKGKAGATQVLVDTSPDMREQLLDTAVSTLDGVLITHNHADQLHGLDDLRMIAINMRKRVDVWSDEASLEGILNRFAYCFVQAPGSDYPPVLNAHRIGEPLREFAIGGAGGDIPIRPFRQGHGAIHSLGFRFGPIAYSSDVHTLDDEAFEALHGVKVWIVDALRYTPHPTHSHVERSLDWIARLKPERAILTNMHVDLDYEKLKAELPPNVEPAYDGMTVTLPP